VLKLFAAFFILVLSTNCWADTALCTVEIENVSSNATYTLEHSFEYSSGAAAARKHFDLPGSEIKCTLVFGDLNSGTMLSCQLDELGHHFVQSDRSIIKERRAKNNLSFRYKSFFYVLKSSCK
jgi:hypothetical protein